jgi:hypothetical protein
VRDRDPLAGEGLVAVDEIMAARSMAPVVLALALGGIAAPVHAGVAFFGRTTDTIEVSGQTVFGTAATYEAMLLFPSVLHGGGNVFNEWQNFAEDKYFAVTPGPTGAVYGYDHAISPGVLTGVGMITLDVWHHVAYVYDGAQERVYLDGTLLQSQAAGGDVADSGGSIAHVGAIFRDNVLRPSFVGLIDVLRLSDVARYAGASFTPPIPDLLSDANTVLLYTFDEAPDSQVVADGSPLGRVGAPGVGFGNATPPSFCGDDSTDGDGDFIPDACDQVATTTTTMETTTTIESTSTTSMTSPSTTTTLPGSTTTSTVVTTSSTIPTTTTTGTATSSTTTSTLPADPCGATPTGPTFVSIACRVEALAVRVGAAGELSPVRAKLLDQLETARTKLEQAETACRGGSKRRTRSAMRPAIGKLAQVRRTLGSRRARSAPQALRDELRAVADAIRGDMRTLQRASTCPVAAVQRAGSMTEARPNAPGSPRG